MFRATSGPEQSQATGRIDARASNILSKAVPAERHARARRRVFEACRLVSLRSATQIVDYRAAPIRVTATLKIGQRRMQDGGASPRDYRIASMPFLSARASSLREGPLGRTSPRS